MNFKKEEKQQLNVKVPVWMISKIERLMQQEGCGKNKAVEELLKHALRDYEISKGGWDVKKYRTTDNMPLINADVN